MPTFNANLSGDPNRVEDELIRLRKDLEYNMNNLDSQNVKRLYTNRTDVRSQDGETIIDGPTLYMYDGSTTLRLRMGYVASTSNFTFDLYNNLGTQTVSINSSGDAVFTGIVEGGVVRSGSTTEDRIELSGGAFTAYTTAGQKTGLYFDISTIPGTGITDVTFYHNNLPLAEFYDFLTGLIIRPTTQADVFVVGNNAAGAPPTQAEGRWQFNGNVGFYGSTGTAKVTVANLSTAATLAQTIDKVNEVIDALQAYGLA